MTAFNVSIDESAPLPAPDATRVGVFVGPFPGVDLAGPTSGIFVIQPGDDLITKTGCLGGELADDVNHHLANGGGQKCLIAASTPTWGALSAVLHDAGNGPNITAALVDSATGPYLGFTLKGAVTRAGALGVARFEFSLDGDTAARPFVIDPIPAELPAAVDSSVSCEGGYDLEGYTIVLTAPGSATLTFSAGSRAASTAGLKVATATSASPVTLTSASLLDAGEAELAAFPRRLKFTTAGTTPSDAPANVVITGVRRGQTSASSETLSLSQSAGSVLSVQHYVSIVSLAYAAGDGTGATIAIGYSSCFGSAQEIADAVSTLADAAPVAVAGEVSMTSAGSYLRIKTDALGAGASLKIDNASTAPLTFDTATTFAGSASTYTIPYTNVRLTFASGDYALADRHTLTGTGPSSSLAAVLAAMDRARAQFFTEGGQRFGFVVVDVVPATASACDQFEQAIAGKLDTWIADQVDFPAFVWGIVGSPWHTASATKSANLAAINAADAELNAALAGHPATKVTIALEDCYRRGTLITGWFRRSAAVALATRMAAIEVGQNPGRGYEQLPGITARGPNGVFARIDNDSGIAMHADSLGGAGFTVLRTDAAGRACFGMGTTCAGAQSIYREIGVVTPIYALAGDFRDVLIPHRAEGDPVEPDGTVDEVNASTVLGELQAKIDQRASAREITRGIVTIDLDEKVIETANKTFRAEIQPTGKAESFTMILTAAGAITLPEEG